MFFSKEKEEIHEEKELFDAGRNFGAVRYLYGLRKHESRERTGAADGERTEYRHKDF